MSVDLYEILGVSPDADGDEIKQAFRRLAKEYHPDRNPDDPDAEERFKEALAAFEILSDPAQRRRYDRRGFEGLRTPEKAGFRGDEGGEGEGSEDPWWSAGGGLGDSFADVFGGKSPFDISHFEDVGDFDPDEESAATGAPPAPEDGEDVHRALTVEFLEAVRGEEVGFELDGESVRIQLQEGVESGDRMRVPGYGEPSPDEHGEDGDLVLELEVRDHPRLRRDGLDLSMELPVTVAEAALGAELTVPTLEGAVQVELPAGVDSGTKLRIEGRGVRRSGECGDLYCVVEIVTPDRVDDEIEEAVRALERGYTFDVRRDMDLESD